MAKWLRQSTAAVIPFGPILDKTDGVTLEVAAGIITSLDHAATGIFLSKNGGAGAIRHAAVTASVLDAYGMFLVTLDTTDTNTLGRLRVMMAEAATFLPVWDDYMVLPANVYDSLVLGSASDLLDVNVGQWLGTACAAVTTGGVPEVDVTHWVGGAATAGAIPAFASGAVGGLPVIGLNAHGYEGGWVWFGAGGTAGTVSYVNGTVLNPTSTMASARTIADALLIKGFRVLNGNTIALDQAYTGFTFFGYKWTLQLATRVLTNCYFEGAAVSGIAHATGTGNRFVACDIGAVTAAACTMSDCGLNSTFTVGAAGAFTFNGCYASTAAGAAAIIDFGAGIGATTMRVPRWYGNLQVLNMGVGDTLVVGGMGKLELAASCTAGTVLIRGNIELTNSGSGQTITDTSRYSEDQNVTTVTGNVTGSVGSVAAGGITSGSFGAGAIDAAAIKDAAIDAATFAADAISAGSVSAAAVTKIQAGLATPTNITAGTITTVTNLTNAATVGDLTAVMKASVNTEVLDVINVDTYVEPVQGAPAATASLAAKINWLFKAWRNKKTQTATEMKIYNDAGAVVDHKATVSDDGTTFSQTEIESGP